MWQFYLVLLFCTAVIGWLAGKMWRQTNNYSILIGVFALYYWSLSGAWFLVWDAFNDNSAQNIGLHYYYIFEKMFVVHADSYYMQSILYYALFIIVLQIAFLYTGTRHSLQITQPKTREKLNVNHNILVIISLAALIFSFICIYPDVRYAISNNKSFYYVVRHSINRWYTIHQLLNLIAAFSVLFGFTLLMIGDNNKYFKFVNVKRSLTAKYIISIILVLSYLLLLGNKHELLFCGIFTAIVYISFSQKINWIRYAALIAVIAIPLTLNDSVRRYPPAVLKYFLMGDTEHPEPSHGDMSILSSVAFSNEMFFAHVSMYGCVAQHLPPTMGSSLINLVASAIPRVIYDKRPEDIYTYYVNSLKLPPGQGYTIHHATAWYLNFGIIGVICGALFLGWLWKVSWKAYSAAENRNNMFLRIISLIAFASFVSFLPLLIRNGPEAYKALFVEGMLLPAGIIWLAVKPTADA
ncbi:MAG TPA: hypothetical protein VFW78_07190 [Bacteroidia bacterium]|nr:hypothetical protein [Bacteroidia bacterium]